jgi:transketolase
MTAEYPSCRHAFSAAILEAASADPSIVVVTSDAKGSVTLGGFEVALPKQFVEMGIAEQNSVGVAAGMARCGRRVFVCGPASFYAARSVEQIKNDVAYADTDVKVVGVSGGVSYGALGSTHHSLHDLALMRAIPNIAVLLPCDTAQTAVMTRYLAGHRGPVYMRLGRGPVPHVYESETHAFTFARARMLGDGRDCTIISAGEALYHAVVARRVLEERGFSIRILDMATIKPIDEEAVVRAARETGAIVTVEEHSVHGGLGSAVAEIVVGAHPVPVKIIGFPDEFVPAGSSAELFDYYRLSASGLVDTITEFLSARAGDRG